jgi:anti-anti-sigma factor
MFEALEVGGVTVLFLTGDLDGDSCAQVKEVVSGLIAAGRRMLVLDLTRVERVYTTGLFMLLDMKRAATREGGRLVCCGARPFVREIMRITMLDRVLDLHMDLDGALDQLSRAS